MKLGSVLLLLFILTMLFVLGHGSWHVALVSLGNGITSFFTGAP